MRSLFLRIFVFYWIASGLVLGITLTATGWVAWQRERAFDELEPTNLSDGATAALTNGGRDGLVNWTRSANSSIASPNIYMFDETGHELLGRTVGPNLLRRAAMEVTAIRAGKSWTRGPRFAAVITAPGAGNFMLVVTAAASGPLLALGNIGVLGIFVLVALGVVGLVCWAVARTITQPLVRLQLGARALANGDLSVRVGPEITERGDELGALARDFDLMAQKLRRLLASKETLMRDLSHELRSPLARMRVAMGLARINGASAETQFARMERESERMDVLIGQLLRLSRLMNVELRPAFAQVDLSEMVTEIVDDARLEASDSHKIIEWNYPGEMIVRADAEMVRHAIENVLRNALRFSPENGVITVALKREAGATVLLVQDQGPGVPEEELPRIFEPFFHASNSEGTGVGLAITAQVMALHQGSVVARNLAGGGLEVEFRFG